MFGVIIREFRHGEEAGPVGLLVVAVDSQVLLEDGVEPLCLAICLGMEGGRPVGTDSQKLDESSPEVGGEDWVSLADHSFGQAMKPDDVLDAATSCAVMDFVVGMKCAILVRRSTTTRIPSW